MAFKGQGFQLHDPVAQRALTETGQFTRDIRHVAGQQNAGSDYLSRIPKIQLNSPSANDKGTIYQDIATLEGHKLEATSAKLIAEEQSKCPETQSILEGRRATLIQSFSVLWILDQKFFIVN